MKNEISIQGNSDGFTTSVGVLLNSDKPILKRRFILVGICQRDDKAKLNSLINKAKLEVNQ